MKELLQKNPFRVPTGDAKIIEEHFGNACLGGDQLSLARMVTPPPLVGTVSNSGIR